MTTSIRRQPSTTPPAASKKSAVVGLAGWSIAHPVIAVLGWIALVLACVVGGNLAGMH